MMIVWIQDWCIHTITHSHQRHPHDFAGGQTGRFLQNNRKQSGHLYSAVQTLEGVWGGVSSTADPLNFLNRSKSVKRHTIGIAMHLNLLQPLRKSSVSSTVIMWSMYQLQKAKFNMLEMMSEGMLHTADSRLCLHDVFAVLDVDLLAISYKRDR